ncbi:MAG: hypothetical protein KGL63_05990 [Betaproteobacteria bacterium]|nr:hypothetical protein [Betaproteobacteria bacterium]
MNATRWYVVDADPRKLDAARITLKAGGFEVFVPTQIVRIKPSIRGKRATAYSWVEKPMFFSFLFCAFDAETQSWPRRDSRVGIRKLLTFSNGRPAPVEAGFVERLIQEAPKRLRIPQKGLPAIAVGKQVLIIRGALQGHVATVLDCNRFQAKVEMTIFGGSAEVRLLRSDITEE